MESLDADISEVQILVPESEAKQQPVPTKETKNNKMPVKVSKRIAEAAEKRESQANAENGLAKKNKKTENGEHSDKKSDKSDCNNGLSESAHKEDFSDDLILQIDDELESDVSKKHDTPDKSKQNANSQEKPTEKPKVEAANESLNQTAKDKEELANGEQSFHNMSFGRTLRKISGRRSTGRLNDSSINSSMFVNTSQLSTTNDEHFEAKLREYRSNFENSLARKRKAANDELSSLAKRSKTEQSSGFSFNPLGLFQSWTRYPAPEVRAETESAPTESANSRCLIM